MYEWRSGCWECPWILKSTGIVGGHQDGVQVRNVGEGALKIGDCVVWSLWSPEMPLGQVLEYYEALQGFLKSNLLVTS